MTKKHPPARSCRIRQKLVIASPSARLYCGLGLRNRNPKKCEGCTENIAALWLEGFKDGMKIGASVPTIQEQLQAHAMEKLNEMHLPELSYEIKAVDLANLEAEVPARPMTLISADLAEGKDYTREVTIRKDGKSAKYVVVDETPKEEADK